MRKERVVRRATTIPAPVRIRPSQSFDGDDGKWSTFIIGVGSPAQNFRVLPATQVSETWVISSEGCGGVNDPTDCYARRGGENFNGNPPRGFQLNQSSTWNEIGLYELRTEENLNIIANGQFGTDVVSLNGGNGSTAGQGISLGDQVVAAVPNKNYFLGSLGLSIRPSQFSSSANPRRSFLDNLFYNDLVPSRSYGYTAGAYYGDNAKQAFGSLTLGGYDSTRLNSNKSLSLAFGSKDSRQLVVGVQSITVSNSLNGTASMTAGTGGHLSLIDSTVSQLWLPKPICDNIASNFGLFYDNNTDLYLINSTMHNRWVDANPSFTFKLGETAYDNGKSVNIVLPYKAFDFQLAWPVYSSSVFYFPMRKAANDSQYTLGRTLLQEAYIIVDYDRKNFTLAAANFPDTTTSPNIITITNPVTSPGSSSGLGAGAIAGIVVGAVVVLVLAIIGGIWIRRRRNKDTTKDGHEIDGNEVTQYKDPKVNPEAVEIAGSEYLEMEADHPGGFKPRHELHQETATPIHELPGSEAYTPYPTRSPQISTPGTGVPSPGQPSPMYHTGSSNHG